MLVWNAMPSITLMMSVIFFELSLIELIVRTTCPITSRLHRHVRGPGAS